MGIMACEENLTEAEMRIYLAGPLFSEAERDWMRKLKQKIIDHSRMLGADLEVDWPWEFITEAEIEQLGDRAGRQIFLRCKAKLDIADILIAWLDGPQVDDGTAWEIGYFYSLHSVSPADYRHSYRPTQRR